MAASRRVVAARWLTLRFRELNTRSPLTLWLGLKPNQEANAFSWRHFAMLVPISLSKVNTASTFKPGMAVKSTPRMRFSWPARLPSRTVWGFRRLLGWAAATSGGTGPLGPQAGLSPNNKVSGQRVLSSRTRQVNNRAATILRLAAVAVGKTDTPLGAFYRRKRAQLGGPKAITATARKLACLIYRLIKAGQGYQEGDARAYELNYKDQMVRSLRRRAKGLGFELVEVPQAA